MSCRPCRAQRSAVGASLRQRPFAVTVARLPTGGYLINDIILIERKAEADVVASLIDGRLFPLVEAKQSVIENMAPVLTRLFTPLFTVRLLVLLATMAWTGSPINAKREVLIGFDLLVVVVALVLYAASARDPQAPPDFFDGLQVLLVVRALVVDGVPLAAIAARISEFGFATGWRLLAEISFCSSTWPGRRGSMHASCAARVRLPLDAVWAALVVVMFPPVFAYR